MAISRVTDQEWAAYQQRKFQKAVAEDPDPLTPFEIKAEQDRFQEMVAADPNPIEDQYWKGEQESFARFASQAENPLDRFQAEDEQAKFAASVEPFDDYIGRNDPHPAPAVSSQPAPDLPDGKLPPSGGPANTGMIYGPALPPRPGLGAVGGKLDGDPVARALAHLEGPAGEDDDPSSDTTPDNPFPGMRGAFRTPFGALSAPVLPPFEPSKPTRDKGVEQRVRAGEAPFSEEPFVTPGVTLPGLGISDPIRIEPQTIAEGGPAAAMLRAAGGLAQHASHQGEASPAALEGIGVSLGADDARRAKAFASGLVDQGGAGGISGAVRAAGDVVGGAGEMAPTRRFYHGTGKRVPIRADDGSAVEHDVVVVFPESLPKLRNAISGTMGGQADTQAALDAGLTAGGGAYGYATAEPQREGESDAEYELRRIGRAATSAMGGAGLAAMTRPGVRRAIGEAVAPTRLGITPEPPRSDFYAWMQWRKDRKQGERGVGRQGPRSLSPDVRRMTESAIAKAELREILAARARERNRPPESSGGLDDDLLRRIDRESEDILDREGSYYDPSRIMVGDLPGRQPARDPNEDFAFWEDVTFQEIEDRAEEALTTRSQVLADLAAARAARRGAKEPVATAAAPSTALVRPLSETERADVLRGLDQVHTQEGLARPVGPLREPSAADTRGMEYAHRQGKLDVADQDVPEVDLPPEKVAWWHKVGRSARGLMGSQFGSTGKEIADRAWQMREDFERLMAEWVKRTPTSRAPGFTNEMHHELADVLENKATSQNALVNKAADEYRALFDEGYDLARTAGVDVAQKIEHYYPHSWNEPLSVRIRDSRRRREAQEYLVSSGQAADAADANDLLRARNEWEQALRGGQRWNATERRWVPDDQGFGFRRHGNLEMERETDLPGYERSQAAIDKHLMGVARRIYEAAHFGPQGEIGTAMMQDLARQGYDMRTAEGAVRAIMGTARNDETMTSFARGLRFLNTITKLELAVIGNATQSLTNTAPVVGLERTLKAMEAVVADDPEARDFIARSGVTIEAILREIQEGQGFSTRVLGLTLPGFRGVELSNRSVAAIAGRDYARDMADLVVQGNQQARRALVKMGLDADAVVKRGGVLTDDEEITAARNIVERTQFRVDAQDLPMWASHPAGRIVAQFRTFGYKQSNFIWNEIVQEARQKNIAPLLRFLVLAPLMGMIGVEGRNVVAGREPEQDMAKRVSGWVGAPLGLVADAQRAVLPINAERLPQERYTSRIGSFILGPTGGMIGDAAGLAYRTGLAIGDVKAGEDPRSNRDAALRIALEQVPVFGAVLPNRMFPYKKREEMVMGASQRVSGSQRASSQRSSDSQRGGGSQRGQ